MFENERIDNTLIHSFNKLITDDSFVNNLLSNTESIEDIQKFIEYALKELKVDHLSETDEFFLNLLYEKIK